MLTTTPDPRSGPAAAGGRTEITTSPIRTSEASSVNPPYASEPGDAARPPRPRPGWRQVGRDLLYLLPGLPIAIVSFCLLMVGFWLGVGLVPLALLGLVIMVGTLVAGRGFAAAERARLRLAERRPVGPAYYRRATGTGLSRILSYLRDPQAWRDFGYGLLILPVRVFTWSLTITWIAGSLMITYGLWAWSLRLGESEDDVNGLADLVFGWDTFAADVLVNTALAVPFLLSLPYVVRGLALVESSLAWAMLTNENTALRARAEQLSRSRQAVVQAEADTLRRVERDIHDGPQQRLVRLTMDLQSAQRRLGDDPAAAGSLVEGALVQTQEALAELRALSRGIAPPILTDRGLAAALAAAAARCPIPTTLDIELAAGERLPSAVENAAYFVATESLTNVAKHSAASRCEVSARVIGGVLTVRVADDGRGGAHLGKGHGLAGLADRLAGVDGRLSVDSAPGGGTAVTATIPIAT
jgi:signal transduction histidine kinase